jgi:GT2 family glycosyltransferase/predicted SAM-dependent methyltransferase
MAECSIIIPVHNKASVTRQCLDTLLSGDDGGGSTEIVVVDDASTDVTPRLLEGYRGRVRVVTHQTNTGFAQACNDGAAVAAGAYLIFLNNDVVPERGWRERLLDHARAHPNAGIVGSKLLYRDGRIQHAGVVICRNRMPTHVYNGFPSDHPAVNKSRRLQAVTAASMLVRRGTWDAVGGFDVSYINALEDIDFCLRAGEKGYEVHYCHESVAWHLESVSRRSGDARLALQPDEEHSARLFLTTWATRVEPDELRVYEEDGLLQVTPRCPYPIGIAVSPHLAVRNDDEADAQVTDRLLHSRATQVQDLLHENIRLQVQTEEMVLAWQAAHQRAGGLPLGWPALRANASFFDVRHFVAGLYLHGEGIEIGALHAPMVVGRGVRVRYVDRMSVAELRRQYPELDDKALVEPDIIDNGERLERIGDASQDFVIASHFLEHCQDPIGTVAAMLRVLRPGGVLYLAVPDKRYTFDRRRPVTPFAHLLRDYREGPAWSKAAHFEEWATLAEDEHIKGRSAETLMAIDYSIHFHVWTQSEVLELLARLQTELAFEFDVETVVANAIEVIAVLRKRAAGPGH